MANGSWYNGFSWTERMAKYHAYQGMLAAGILAPPRGPCQLCNDPDVPVEPHDEDYAAPYVWTAPATFALCKACHLGRVHRRFADPVAWDAFLAHVRRGGYARDLRVSPGLNREVSLYREALRRGERASLRSLRSYPAVAGTEWFAALRTDVASLTDPQARPVRTVGERRYG